MVARIVSILYFCFLCYCVRGQTFTTPASLFSAISSYKLIDTKENKTVAVTLSNKPLTLFVFLSPECPVCQGYTKTLNHLQEKYQQQVNLYGIVPGSAYTIQDVAAFEKEYNISFKLFIDTKQKLTRYLKATVTPQVVLLNRKGVLIYTGAIDDWVVSLGKKRLHVTEHYVQDAIDQSLLAATVKIKETSAVGCRINDY